MDEILFTVARFSCDAAHAVGADGLTRLMGYGPDGAPPPRDRDERNFWEYQKALVYAKGLSPCSLPTSPDAILITGALTIAVTLMAVARIWKLFADRTQARRDVAVERQQTPNFDR